MLFACWSAKGGSGATVVSVALASMLARSSGAALLVDLAGDVPAALGLSDEACAGVGEWLAAGDGVPADALPKLEVAGPAGLRVLVLGSETPPAGPRGDVLAAVLASEPRPVVADCGTAPSGVALTVARSAATSLLVTRACLLALRRAQTAAVRPTGVVLVREAGRALGAIDVERVLGAPVVAQVPADDAVARAVDAGTLGARLPRSLQRSLRHVA